jgi:hypothetical protein
MASPRPAGLESLGVTRPSPLFALAAALAVSLALGIAPQSAAQQLPLRVGIAVQVIEVEPDPKDQPGLTARVKADVERMLRMSHRKVLTEYHYALPLGKAAHFLLPNGCEGDVTPMAIVRLKIEVKTGTTFNLELSVKAGGSFKVGAGRSTHGHLLLSISPRL